MRTPSIILFLLLYSTSVCQCTAGDLLVTISEKTTHITGPLQADGYPDYLAALNARFRTESSPQNNLAVGIWETVGPTEIPVELRPLLFEPWGSTEFLLKEIIWLAWALTKNNNSANLTHPKRPAMNMPLSPANMKTHIVL